MDKSEINSEQNFRIIGLHLLVLEELLYLKADFCSYRE